MRTFYVDNGAKITIKPLIVADHYKLGIPGAIRDYCMSETDDEYRKIVSTFGDEPIQFYARYLLAVQTIEGFPGVENNDKGAAYFKQEFWTHISVPGWWKSISEQVAAGQQLSVAELKN